MKYELRRRLYSQNNLVNPKLIAKLIRKFSIGKNDKVIEIGPGRGIITQELLKASGKVIAVEIDNHLYHHLVEKYKYSKNLELMQGDILKFNLPSCAYKVFANIPFIITADIIKKLTSDSNFQEAYLIIQKEAAKKFIGMPYDNKNSMMATLLKPLFEISIFWNFKRTDFIPIPNVDIVMIRITRRNNPLIPLSILKDFRDFILYTYNRKKMARLEFFQIVKLFNHYIHRTGAYERKIISIEAEKILKRQENLEKIHRTRVDKNWYKFKSRKNQ